MYKVYGNYLMHCSDDTLAHHGILGMHWGVRRYQNEDGTLTEAGRKRYANYYKNGAQLPSGVDAENISNELRNNKYYSSRMNELRIAQNRASKATGDMIDTQEKFLFGKQYEKVVDSMSKKIAKDYGRKDVETIRKSIINGEFDEGDKLAFLYYIDSDMPGSKEAKNVYENWQKQVNNVRAMSRSIVEDVLGKYGNNKIGKKGLTTIANMMAEDISLLREGQEWY